MSQLLGFSVLIAAWVSLASAAPPNAPPPVAARASHVFFLFADDLSYQAMAGPDNSEVATPNLDRLTRRGTVLHRAYNRVQHGVLSAGRLRG